LVFNKKYIFLSARVHPGEVPSSHCLNSFLEYILDSNNERILDEFVFVVVPMINPDGVYRGHWRVDSLGQNLNRFYSKPSKDKQPSIYMIDLVLKQL
jgi:murein tripeptide amidase MpaA